MTTYSDADRQRGIDLYLQHGAAEAARQIGCTARTIRRWASDADVSADRDQNLQEAAERGQAQAEADRAQLRATLMAKAVDLMSRMDEPHVDFKGKGAAEVTYPKATSSDVKNYATSVGILIDKYRLEVGEATSRTEVSAESDVDRELRLRIAEWERQLSHGDT